MPMGLTGRWRIGFLAVEGWMDTRRVDRDGRPGLEFSWEGTDELDPGQWTRLGNAGT